MKILFVTDVFPPHCGGSGWSVYFFARVLRRNGHEVRIVCLDGKPRGYDGFEVQAYFTGGRRIPFLGNLKAEILDLPEIGEEIAKEARAFDIVHTHHKWSTIAVATAGRPFFATIRDTWPICICGRSTFRTEAACSAHDFSRCSEDEFGWPGLAAPLLYPLFEPRMRRRRDLLTRALRIFCISAYLRDQMLPFFPPAQLTVLPNFSETIEAPAPQGLPPRFCIYIGKLEINKGAALLPRLMKSSGSRLPLLILGEGSLRTKLEVEFTRQAVEAHFLGYREYPEMLSFLKRADFLLFPSLWAEPLGRVLIEAAMLGIAVIAFQRPGGHQDVIRNGESGILADTEDAFAQAISLLESREDLRQRLGQGGRRIYEVKFHPDAVTDQLLTEYISHSPQRHKEHKGPDQ